MNLWSSQGFRFDTGPSLITMPWIFDDLFRVAGTRLEDHCELVCLHPLARYIFDDGLQINYSTALPDWLATIRDIEPRDVEGFFRYMRLGARIYELSRVTFLRRMPGEKPDRKTLAALRHLPLRHSWGNYHRTVVAHFCSPYFQQLFDRYPTYVGSSPYKIPATFTIIPYLEYAFGGWYVLGGLYRLIECLVELLQRAQVNLINNMEVVSIEHQGKGISGIVLADGIRIPADVVIMNGDPSRVPQLLGKHLSAGLPVQDRSLSGVVILLGISRTLPQFHHHAIYFSRDYHQEFHQLFHEQRFPDDPTVYVNIASRSDRSLVPGGGETLYLMANAPANGGSWDTRMIGEVRRKILERIRKGGFPDIESDIVVSDIWTPGRMASQYLMPGGVIYGTNSHGWKRAFLRPPNVDRFYRGLYYVGGGTHPGGGTPTVLLSAEITSRLIEKHAGS